MLRWTPAPRAPRRRGRPVPARAVPRHRCSRPHRVGDPASARAFARPYRDVAERLAPLGAAGPPAPRRPSRRSTCTSTPRAGSPSAASSAPWTSRGGPRTPTTGSCCPTRASTPRRPTSSPTGWREMELNPAPILLVHRGPSRVRALVHDVLAAAAGPRVHRPRRAAQPVLGDPRSAGCWPSSREHLAGCPPADRRRAPPLRGLPAAAASSDPGTSADRGLAMLVDQDDTPLFLGAIHRTLAQTALADVETAADGSGRVRAGQRGGGDGGARPDHAGA